MKVEQQLLSHLRWYASGEGMRPAPVVEQSLRSQGITDPVGSMLTPVGWHELRKVEGAVASAQLQEALHGN